MHNVAVVQVLDGLQQPVKQEAGAVFWVRPDVDEAVKQLPARHQLRDDVAAWDGRGGGDMRQWGDQPHQP